MHTIFIYCFFATHSITEQINDGMGQEDKKLMSTNTKNFFVHYNNALHIILG